MTSRYEDNKELNNAIGVPIDDLGGYYTSDEVEDALQEIGAAGIGNYWDRTGTVLTTDTAGDTVSLLDDQLLTFGNTNDITVDWDTGINGLHFQGGNIRMTRNIVNAVSAEANVDRLMNVSPTAHNSRVHTCGTYTANLLTNYNLTSTSFGGLLGTISQVFNYGTGTVTKAVGNSVSMGIAGTGHMTNAYGYIVEPYITNADGVVNQVGLAVQNNSGVGSFTNGYFAEIGGEYLSNGRSIKNRVQGGSDIYLPFSSVDTGLTFDNTDLVFATTTSGDIVLNPFGDILANKDIIIPQNGVATGVNFGVPSFAIELNAESWNIAGGVGVPTTTRIYNYQPVGFDQGNATFEFDGDLRFIIDQDGMVFVPDLAGGDEFTFGSSIAASGKGTNMNFKGGNAVSGNNNGGDLRMEPGQPAGSGVPGTINFGQSGLADQGCIFFKQYMRYQSELDYDGREEHTADTLQTSNAADQVINTSYDLEDNSALRVSATVHAVETDGSDRGVYKFEGEFYRDGGNVTQQGSTTYTSVQTSDLNWDAGFQLDTVSQTVEIYVNGNGDTVNWTAYLENSRITTA